MFEARPHDGPRVRLWTPDMEAYGQFDIVPAKKVHELKALLDELGVGSITVHHCDSHENCKCRPTPKGEKLDFNY